MLETIDNDSLLSMFLFQWENELHTYILDHHSVVEIMRQPQKKNKIREKLQQQQQQRKVWTNATIANNDH